MINLRFCLNTTEVTFPTFVCRRVCSSCNPDRMVLNAQVKFTNSTKSGKIVHTTGHSGRPRTSHDEVPHAGRVQVHRLPQSLHLTGQANQAPLGLPHEVQGRNFMQIPPDLVTNSKFLEFSGPATQVQMPNLLQEVR